MMIPINVAADILKAALDFTSGVVGKFDEEKYAKAVNEIYGHEPHYSELDTLAELIKNATDIPTNEKIVLLQALADKRREIRETEFEYKRTCAQTIDNASEKRADIILKIFGGILIAASAGLTAYGVTKGIKGRSSQLQIEPRKRRKN